MSSRKHCESISKYQNLSLLLDRGSGQSDKVIITGLTDSGIDKDILSMYFESKKGGLHDVAHVEMDVPVAGEAVVSFVESGGK